MDISELDEVFVYTDSTGFPRSNDVSLAQTWPILLAETGVPSMIRGRGGIRQEIFCGIFRTTHFTFHLTEKSKMEKDW